MGWIWDGFPVVWLVIERDGHEQVAQPYKKDRKNTSQRSTFLCCI